MEVFNQKTGNDAGKTRAEKIVRIDALVSFGVSIAEACRRENFPRPSYYRAKAREVKRAA